MPGGPIVIEGRRYHSYQQAANARGLKPKTVMARLTYGWTTDEAFGVVPRREKDMPLGRSIKPIVVGGVAYPSRTAAAAAHGIPAINVALRLKAGWSIEETFNLVPQIGRAHV